MDYKEVKMAIAEICGYKNIGLRPRRLTGEYYDDLCARDKNGNWDRKVPDYINDLNACEKFECRLTLEERSAYVDQLLDSVCYGTNSSINHAIFQVASATAFERCIAFLRVKGKWRE